MRREIFPVLLLFVHQSGLFGGNWTKVSTQHFEIDTQADTQDALRALTTFEEARAVLVRVGLARPVPELRVRVIDLQSDIEYSPYLIKPGAYGCYQRGRRGDYVVLRDISAAHSQVAVHEYTHFVVEHAGLKLPVWLNEGIAELYSTMEVNGPRSLIGRAQPGRLLALETYRRIPLETVFAVDGASHYYNDPSAMQIFYAESWALTHMLAIDDRYSHGFDTFVRAVSSGSSAEAGLSSAYGKSVRAVETELQAYLRQRRFRTVSYDIDPPGQLQPVVGELPRLELDLSAADLLASNAGSGSEALDKVRELARRHPNEADFEETLGYVALRDNRQEEARAHFTAAVEQQSNDPVTIYNSVCLQQAAGASAEQAIPLLERVLELNPDYEAARLDLGFTAASANRFDLAVAALSRLRTLNPKTAFDVLYTMAYCELQLKRRSDASAHAAQAAQYVRNSEQRERIGQFMRFLERQQRASLRN